MGLTPEKYVELVFKMSEALKLRVPAMMADIKDELENADFDAQQASLKTHLEELRKVIDQEDMPEDGTSDVIMAYERKSGNELKQFFTKHPDLKKKLDDLRYEISELMRP